MGSLTSRGRALVVVAFLVSAALCGTSAVALVVASRDDGTPSALPSPSATPTPTESPTPEPTTSPTPVVTTAPTPTATAAPTPSATASPTKRPTTAPRPSPTRTVQALGLFADAALTPANGDTTTATLFTLNAHATDGDGSISLLSLDWGDGTALVTGTKGTACPAKAPADCRDFEWTHKYATVNTDGYKIILKIQSGDEVSTLHLVAYVNGT